MALRQEDIHVESLTATVYRFPVERSEVARIRRGIAVRKAARRRHRAGLAAVGVVVVAMTLLGGGQEATAPAAGEDRRFVVVQPGDTLWGLAQRHAPEGTDLRVYVDALAEVNDLSSELPAGLRIRLP